MRNRKRGRLIDLYLTLTFFPRKRQEYSVINNTYLSLPCPQPRFYLPNPSQLPSQAGTRCVPASSGRAADPQQAVPPSPGPGIVVTAETPASGVSRM